MKPWQHGVPIDELRAHAAVFDRHDTGVVLSRMSRFGEQRIAEAISKHRFVVHDGWRAACRCASSRTLVSDFTGSRVAVIVPGVTVIERLAYDGDVPADLLAWLADRAAVGLVVTIYQEHAADRALVDALGLDLLAVKVSSFAEVRGVYGSPPAARLRAPSRFEQSTLGPLSMPPFDVTAAADELRLVTAWAEHYSNYNVRRSWSAVALRGFSDDPAFIEKPSEMTKSWQAAHPEALDWQPRWTELRDRLPAVMSIVDALPGEKQRVRLMRVRAGGALSRHTDIQDKDAGTGDGKIARVHVPIVTNPGVLFSSVDLDGARLDYRMPVGQPCYLDVRKPHAAENRGTADRTHLVVDLHATAPLRALLPTPGIDRADPPPDGLDGDTAALTDI